MEVAERELRSRIQSSTFAAALRASQQDGSAAKRAKRVEQNGAKRVSLNRVVCLVVCRVEGGTPG
jgi:hypothetical protein